MSLRKNLHLGFRPYKPPPNIIGFLISDEGVVIPVDTKNPLVQYTGDYLDFTLRWDATFSVNIVGALTFIDGLLIDGVMSDVDIQVARLVAGDSLEVKIHCRIIP